MVSFLQLSHSDPSGCVFAYGQTASGKTHTMSGNGGEPGVIPQAMHEIFDFVRNSAEREFLIRVSYAEIYNESVADLLRDDHANLKIHEDPTAGFYVGDLTEILVTREKEVLDLLREGNQRRHVGETEMNEKSSRSHAIFRIVSHIFILLN